MSHGAGKMAQYIKCLPHKREDLELIPQNPCLKAWWHVCMIPNMASRAKGLPGTDWAASLA